MRWTLPLALALSAAMTGCTVKPQTYTGIVTTEMCRDQHKQGMSAAECVRACVKGGSPYALLVGDKLYKLDGNTSLLDAYAGARANVYGARSRGTIHVSSVSAGESVR